eukprot:gene16841-23121_t
MVEGAVSVLAQSPDGVFSVVDLLCTMACKEGGKERPAVVSNLMKQALGDEVGESGGSSEPPSAPPANAATAMRLLLLYITRDGAAREAAADSNLIPRILTLLETWSASYTASVGALEHLSKGKGSGEESLSAAEKEERKKTLLIPVWVEAALLTLDCMAGTSSTRAQSPPLNLPGSTPATTPGQAAGLEQERALALCLSLLKQLHAHADEWAPPLEEALTYDILTPSPGATTQAVLQLLAHITRRHSAAMQVLNQGGHRLLLSFPAGCLLPLVTRLESSVVTILRHILEDPETLESWMEAEIRNFFSQRSAFQHMSSLGTFLNALSRVYNREPVVFFKTATRVCELNMVVGSDRMIRLKSKPKDASSAMPPPPPPPPPGTAARPDATAPKPPAGKKHVPASFVEVINSLVEVILSYKGPEQTPTPADTSAGASAADVQPKRDQQGADAAAPSDMQLDTDFNVQLMHLLQPSSLAAKFASLAPEVMTQTMALKSLAEFCLIFNSTVGLLLKRDTELWPKYKASLGPEFGSSPTAAAATSTDASTTAGNKSVPSTPATKGAGHPASGTGAPIGVTAAPSRAGALIKQVMHHQLVAEHQPLLMPSLGECVVMLLQAVCVRSADGRRRVINELVGTLMVGSASTAHSAEALPLLAPPPEFDSIERQLALNAGPGSSGAFMTKPGYPAPTKVRAMINLVNSLLSAPAPPSRMGAGQAPSAVLSSGGCLGVFG